VDDKAKLGIVIVLLLIVMTVFIAPTVDLEPTALRAMKAASLLFAALVLAGTAIAALLTVSFSPTWIILASDRARQNAAHIVDLNCARLC
jgi:hypothetical protein